MSKLTDTRPFVHTRPSPLPFSVQGYVAIPIDSGARTRLTFLANMMMGGFIPHATVRMGMLRLMITPRDIALKAEQNSDDAFEEDF